MPDATIFTTSVAWNQAGMATPLRDLCAVKRHARKRDGQSTLGRDALAKMTLGTFNAMSTCCGPPGTLVGPLKPAYPDLDEMNGILRELCLPRVVLDGTLPDGVVVVTGAGETAELRVF